MLDIMRRKQRLKWILWLVIASLGLGMLLFFIPGFNTGGDSADDTAATVDGESISLREYLNTYNKTVKQYNNSGRNRLDPETLKAIGMPKQVLDSMISDKVMKLIAKRFGIEVVPAEIQRIIEKHPAFQNQGQFIGAEGYKAILANASLSAMDFEEEISRSLLMKKLRDVLTDSLDISERELHEEFSRTNQKTQVDYALLKVDDYKKRVKPAEAELRSYFDAHKDAYRVKEKRRAHYLLVPFSQFMPAIQVADTEIENELKRQIRNETVDVSHILFSVPNSAKDAEVKAKAEGVLKRAKAGEDFAALAKKFTEDPGTKAQGGNLGPIPREKNDLVKEFADAAFSLKSGEISGLVKTQFGYHIIKALKHDTPSKESVTMTLKLKKAKETAKKTAEEASQQLEQPKDLGAVVSKLGVKTEIKETPLFSQEDFSSNASISQDMRDEVFQLKGKDAIGKVVEDPLGYAIPKLLEIQTPRPGEFSEFRSQVEKDYIDFKAKELVQADAAKLSDAAGKQGSLEKAARTMGLSVKTSDEFALSGTPSSEIGANSQFTSAAFDLEPGAVSAPQPVDENMAVFQVKSRTSFDEPAFQKAKAELRTSLLQKMQGPYFEDYIQRTIEELKKNRKIRTNSKAIELVSSSY